MRNTTTTQHVQKLATAFGDVTERHAETLALWLPVAAS